MHEITKKQVYLSQLNAVHKMGRVIAVFPVKPTEGWIKALVGILMIVVAIQLSIYSLLDLILTVARYGPLMVGNSVLLLPFAFTILLPGVVWTIQGSTNLSKAVTIFDRGLVYRQGARLRSLYWEEIDWFFTSITEQSVFKLFPSMEYTYTLINANGAPIKLGNKFINIQYLGQLLGKMIPPHQFRRSIKKLGNGNSVNLGVLSYTLKGIILNQKQFAWSTIHSIRLADGLLIVDTNNGRYWSSYKAPIAKIPNIEAFLMLATRMLRNNRQN
jgi:hypothetical protein